VATFRATVDLDMEWRPQPAGSPPLRIVAPAGSVFVIPDHLAVEFEQAMGSTANTGPWRMERSVPALMDRWLALQRGEQGDHSLGAICSSNPDDPSRCVRHYDIGFQPVSQPINVGRVPGLVRLS
jgi:hypothetical protein